MSVRSKINLMEQVKVPSDSMKFGGSVQYFPVYVQGADGNMEPLLLTKSQLDIAKERAQKYISKKANGSGHFWKLLFSEYITNKRNMGEYI